jgi:death-on-curing protein
VTDYLTMQDLLAVATAAMQGIEVQIRDFGLLEAAVARPQASAFGQDAYPGLEGKAAALLASLVSNHALIDGNKRLGWLSCYVFLRMNGVTLDAPDDLAEALVLRIAAGDLIDVQEIAATLRLWMT